MWLACCMMTSSTMQACTGTAQNSTLHDMQSIPCQIWTWGDVDSKLCASPHMVHVYNNCLLEKAVKVN